MKNNKVDSFVDLLRKVSTEPEIKDLGITIPPDCEKYGFVTGVHNLGELLQFLADMIEE